MKAQETTLKPLRGHIIVSVNMKQKNSVTIQGSNGEIELFMGHEYNVDNKISQPNICTALSPSKDAGIQKGDLLIVDYLTFAQYQRVGQDLVGDTGIMDGENKVFSIPLSDVEMKFNDKMEPVPVGEFAIVERIYEPQASAIVVNPLPKQMPRHFRVLAMGPKFKKDYEGEVNVGDVVICWKNSDVNIEYTINKKEHTIVRIKSIDVLAVDHDQKENFSRPDPSLKFVQI